MEELMEYAIKRLKEKDIYGDIYLENIIKTEVVVNDLEVEKFTKSNTICGNVRVFDKGKMGFCYFSGRDKNIIDNAILKAKNSTLVNGYEKYILNGKKNKDKLNICDNSFKDINDDDRKNMALYLERAVMDNTCIKMARDTNYTDSLERIFYANSEGLEDHSEKTRFFLYTSAIAENNGSREISESFEISSRMKDIDIEKMGKECALKARNLLNGKPIKSGKYKIMLAPEIACDLVYLLSKLFLGDNIVKGKSLLASKKPGDIIGAKVLNIKDDALLDFKTGSFLTDAEGEPGRNKLVVESGILKTFLFDKSSAILYNLNTTGNSIRTNFKFLPECGVSNFYIDKGRESHTNVTANFSGILVNSLMGLHMADTVSGNFSLAFNGWSIEKGEKTKAIKESLIIGNLKEILDKIIVICDNLKFYGNFGSPTIVIDDVEAAGDKNVL